MSQGPLSDLKVLEFAGEDLKNWSMDERATLTNMAVEAGGTTGIIEPDEVTLEYIVRMRGLDPEEVYETVTGNGISMCGVLPAVIVLETLRLLGNLRKAERVGYATTADVTCDKSRVVGYAGMLFG